MGRPRAVDPVVLRLLAFAVVQVCLHCDVDSFLDCGELTNGIRNHYTKYREWFDGPHKGQMRKDGKKFQARPFILQY